MYVTYVLKDEHGVPFYVGSGSEQRPFDHLRPCGAGRPLVRDEVDRITNGGSSVSVDIIGEFSSKEEAFSLEKKLIAEFGKRAESGLLVNICDGGLGSSGYRATDEQRIANSARVSKFYESIDERIRTSILTKTAMECPEIRSKISKALKNKWQSAEFRERLVSAHTGLKDSELTKKRKADAQREVWASGKKVGKYTDEQVAAIYAMKGSVRADEVAKIYGMNTTYVHKIWRHERCRTNLQRLGII